MRNPIKIYHITHVRNLPLIFRDGILWSDAKRLERELDCRIIGMSAIKKRRFEELPVSCHPGTFVGQYVPFYFCPRSVMLYLLHMGNHPDLDYHEGQSPIVHLQADLMQTIRWAGEHGIRWAFTTSNAGARYTQFYNRIDDLEKVNWNAVHAIDFRDLFVQEGKQAEFLMFESFPIHLIDKIGVYDQKIEQQVLTVLSDMGHIPLVCIEKNWYY